MGRSVLFDFLNLQILGGGVLYFVGAAMWVFAISRVPLSIAYPFTALTFVLVYLASAMLFHEHPSPRAIFGVLLVLAGLAAILWSR
jgi:drug/metabolite transporter (DMT)-like permease